MAPDVDLLLLDDGGAAAGPVDDDGWVLFTEAEAELLG